jgi:4-amino-4-deoxy-L-arabinose transferase-like glycosyltransferase
MQEAIAVERAPDSDAQTGRRRSLWLGIPARSRTGIVVFTLILLIYTLLLLFVPRYKGMTSTDGDEPHYLMITQSLLRDGDLSVANNYRLKQYSPFYQSPISVPHVIKAQGRYVSTHPAFLSMVVLPGFWLFGYRGAAFTMILLTSMAALFTFLLADRFVDRAAAAAAVLFMFLSYPLLFYGRLIYPETAALFLVALGTWSTWRLKETSRPVFAAFAGLSAGLLILFHPKFFALSAALLLLLLMVVGVSRGAARIYGWWAAPAAACFLFLLLITYKTYGPNLVMGLTASGGSKLVGGYLGTNSVWGVFGMFLDRAWGLFIFAPLFMVFPHGLSLQNNWVEWRRWWAFFPVCIAAHVIVLGVFQSWNGGAAPVQRYLVPLGALLVICVALFVERCRSRLAWAVVAVLALLQLINTVWAFRFMVGTYGMERTDNIMLAHFLDNSLVKRFLLFLFPLYHPAGLRAVLLTFFWLLLFAGTIYASYRYYMRHGGAKVSPIVDIRPF